ncbi:MAG: GRP family sugar transporter [Neisseria sp.]|nr:GRP family sugar transporter [Neisseria sp.]
MNWLIALIPAIGWGVQPIILKKIGGKPPNEILGTGLGAMLVGLAVYLFVPHSAVSTQTFLLSMVSGMFWVIGQAGQYTAYNILSVSRTMPISTGLQLIGTSLIGVLMFGEWPGATAKIAGAFAILLLIIGAALTAVSDSPDNKGNITRGLIILASTSIGYWIYSALPKLVNAGGMSIFFPQMLGVFIGAILCVFFFRAPEAFRNPKSYKAMAVGFTFSLSALAYIFSAQRNGVATAYIVTQLNVVIATLGGLYILHEKKTPREFRLTITGLVLIVVGSIITVFL